MHPMNEAAAARIRHGAHAAAGMFALTWQRRYDRSPHTGPNREP